MNGRVTVYGRDMMRAPLYDDSDAQIIVIRDVSGAPIILMVRLNGDTWGMATPDDKDWTEMCIRFGVMPPKPIEEILTKTH